MVGQHGHQHRQREIGVVNAALFGAPAIDRIDRQTRLELGHHLALAGNDPDKHIGAHRSRQHRADQQKRRPPGKQLASQPGRKRDDRQNAHADQQVAMFAPPQRAANQVINRPEHDQKTQRRGNRHARRPVVNAFIDQKRARVKQVKHGEQAKARQPSGIAFPIKPVQVLRHLARRDQVFLRVIKPAAVNRPEFAVNAFFNQIRVCGLGQAGIEKNKIKRRANPGNGRDDMRPAQQQIGPIQPISTHHDPRYVE